MIAGCGHILAIALAKRVKFDQKKEVRKLARERVGIVPASRPLDEKPVRRKPKHKKPAGEEVDGV